MLSSVEQGDIRYGRLCPDWCLFLCVCREFYFAHSQLTKIKKITGLDPSIPGQCSAHPTRRIYCSLTGNGLDAFGKDFNVAQRALGELIKFCTKDDEDLPPSEYDGQCRVGMRDITNPIVQANHSRSTKTSWLTFELMIR